MSLQNNLDETNSKLKKVILDFEDHRNKSVENLEEMSKKVKNQKSRLEIELNNVTIRLVNLSPRILTSNSFETISNSVSEDREKKIYFRLSSKS
jgi:hypothetical protein